MFFRFPEDLLPGRKQLTVKERHRWKRRWSALVWQEPRYRWAFILSFLGLTLLGHMVLWPLLSSTTRHTEEKIFIPLWIMVMSAFTGHLLQFLVSRSEIRRQMQLPNRARRGRGGDQGK